MQRKIGTYPHRPDRPPDCPSQGALTGRLTIWFRARHVCRRSWRAAGPARCWQVDRHQSRYGRLWGRKALKVIDRRRPLAPRALPSLPHPFSSLDSCLCVLSMALSGSPRAPPVRAQFVRAHVCAFCSTAATRLRESFDPRPLDRSRLALTPASISRCVRTSPATIHGQSSTGWATMMDAAHDACTSFRSMDLLSGRRSTALSPPRCWRWTHWWTAQPGRYTPYREDHVLPGSPQVAAAARRHRKQPPPSPLQAVAAAANTAAGGANTRTNTAARSVLAVLIRAYALY